MNTKIVKWTRWEDSVLCVCVCTDHKSACNVVCTHFVIEVYYHPWGWGSGLSPCCWLVVLMAKQQMDWRCWYTTSNTCMCSHTHTHTFVDPWALRSYITTVPTTQMWLEGTTTYFVGLLYIQDVVTISLTHLRHSYIPPLIHSLASFMSAGFRVTFI